MRNQPAEHDVDEEAAPAFPETFRMAEREAVQPDALEVVAFNPAIHPAEEVFHVDRLWAGPAAPDSAKHRRHGVDGETKTGDGEKQQPEVIEPERGTEEMKMPLLDIQEDRRVAVDVDPRHRGE